MILKSEFKSKNPFLLVITLYSMSYKTFVFFNRTAVVSVSLKGRPLFHRQIQSVLYKKEIRRLLSQALLK